MPLVMLATTHGTEEVFAFVSVSEIQQGYLHRKHIRTQSFQ